MHDHDEARRDRLKTALRENLKRRKAQARARATGAAGSMDGAATSDSPPRPAAPSRQED